MSVSLAKAPVAARQNARHASDELPAPPALVTVDPTLWARSHAADYAPVTVDAPDYWEQLEAELHAERSPVKVRRMKSHW